jgi:hypothetical protein
MSIPYEILIRGHEGAFQGAHAIETPGTRARPLTVEDLALFGAEINGAFLARIAELEAALDAATAPPASPPILSTLGAAFANLPDAVQKAFARDFAIVRSLIEGDRIDLAISHVEGLDVPAEIETTRAAIVAMLKA